MSAMGVMLNSGLGSMIGGELHVHVCRVFGGTGVRILDLTPCIVWYTF